MKIRYFCRHCKNQVGELDAKQVDVSQLGFDLLNDEDQQQMVHMNSQGNMDIRTICDSCKETLDKHPNYHELDFFIH
ncbi:anti-sigma-F factor Fin family protein [Halobacillus yeomjeoni]|uniref:Anti-sigma-F factor Fin family protein n=1 Tax=Halobacillus yeomjeoni TaxID=311194 RepID=A0A931MWV7_9BACI|nr:anti-sigma-F factor Fin family protein [Halobacillus yeomjeoni]MBH0231837.1 anti-sigma-F factor Fin family protein [Halobacillus yeomjeoni]MCA0985632.1 anti-sigma-F factor Fin family protein [Halobacillus yeomjeoni]